MPMPRELPFSRFQCLVLLEVREVHEPDLVLMAVHDAKEAEDVAGVAEEVVRCQVSKCRWSEGEAEALAVEREAEVQRGAQTDVP